MEQESFHDHALTRIDSLYEQLTTLRAQLAQAEAERDAALQHIEALTVFAREVIEDDGLDIDAAAARLGLTVQGKWCREFAPWLQPAAEGEGGSD